MFSRTWRFLAEITLSVCLPNHFLGYCWLVKRKGAVLKLISLSSSCIDCSCSKFVLLICLLEPWLWDHLPNKYLIWPDEIRKVLLGPEGWSVSCAGRGPHSLARGSPDICYRQGPAHGLSWVCGGAEAKPLGLGPRTLLWSSRFLQWNPGHTQRE